MQTNSCTEQLNGAIVYLTELADAYRRAMQILEAHNLDHLQDYDALLDQTVEVCGQISRAKYRLENYERDEQAKASN